MKKTIATIILGIIVGVALAACSGPNIDDKSYEPRYISEGTFDDIVNDRLETVLIQIDDDTRIHVSKVVNSDKLLDVKEYVKVKEGVYEEADITLSNTSSLEMLEEAIDRII